MFINILIRPHRVCRVRNGQVLCINIPVQWHHHAKSVTPGWLPVVTLPRACNLWEFTQGADTGHRSPYVQGY